MSNQRLTVATLIVSTATLWMAATVHTATQVQFAALPSHSPAPVDNPTTAEKERFELSRPLTGLLP